MRPCPRVPATRRSPAHVALPPAASAVARLPGRSRTRLAAAVAWSLASAAAFADPRPASAPQAGALREQVLRYTSARASTFFDVTTDGAQLLIGARFGDTLQLASVAAPMGMRSQETFAEAPIASARFLPQDPDTLLYLHDPFGNQNYQIYKLERAGALTTLLSDGQTRHTDLLLSRDGRRLAWAGNARPGPESDVYAAATDAPEAPRRHTELAGRWRPLDFSANGQALLLLRQRAPGDDELWTAAVDGSVQKKLWPPEGAAGIADARYSADGHQLFLISDFFSDAQELALLDLDHPERPARRLTAELKWDVDALACAQDRGAPAAAAIAVNQGGYDRLYLLEPGTLRLMPVSLPSGLVTALRFPTVKSDVLLLGLESPTRPGEIEQLDVRTRRLVRWTRAELGPLEPAALLEPTRASWSSDGLAIPTLVYRPRVETGARLPVLLVLHAGPRSLARPGFDALAQLAASGLGVAVLAPSLRGAEALGKALRGDPDPARLLQQRIRDLSAGLDWIQRQPDLDPGRVVLLDEAPQSGLAAAFELAHPKQLRAVLGADLRDREASRSAQREALAKLLLLLKANLSP